MNPVKNIIINQWELVMLLAAITLNMKVMEREKISSIKEYLNMIKSYLSDIINDHKTQGELKIQLTMEICFISTKDSNEHCTMHKKSDNIEIMIGNETDEISKKHFESLLRKYEEGLEKSMKGIEFIFDSVDLLYYKLHRISLNRGGLYIDSPEWLKNKKPTINPKNNEDKFLQYVGTVALNHEQIKKDPQKILSLLLISEIGKKKDFTSHKNDWNAFVKNNKTIALNILHAPYNAGEVRHGYKSKDNLNRENRVILLIITDCKKWYYLAVKSLPAWLRGIASKHDGDFYCLICLH